MILLLIKTEELKDLGLEVSNTTPRQEISGRTDWFEGTKYFLSLEEGERLAGDLLRMIEHCKRFTQHDRPIGGIWMWREGDWNGVARGFPEFDLKFAEQGEGR